MTDKTMIFTDGAAKGNPGPGGYGVVALQGDKVVELGGFKERTTNNEMELQAVVSALQHVKDQEHLIAIYTDSKYVAEGATSWIFGWMKNGWKTKAGSDVVNKDLWQELQPLLQQVDIQWHKVPGHVGIVGNERADTIASNFAAKGSFALYSGPLEKYGFDISDTSYDEVKAKERSDGRKRSSKKAYSYVSLVDGVVQTHNSWAECESRVKGKKGARFKKSFDTQDEKDIMADFTGR